MAASSTEPEAHRIS